MTKSRPAAPSSDHFEPSGPARDRVYDYVSRQILLGQFVGGSFIEEEQISSAMNVSRTPVREAFHRLEAERFIDLLPRRGALVRQVTAQELSDLYETRRLVEGYSIARICHGKLPIPSEMASLIKRMLLLRNAESHIEHVMMDWSFHRTMVSAGGNEVLAEAYDSLRSKQLRVATTAIAVNPQRIGHILEEHRALLAALVVHDEATARQVLERHLQPAADVMSRLPGFSVRVA